MKATIIGNPETVFSVTIIETIEAVSGMKLKTSNCTRYFDEYAEAYECLMQTAEAWTADDSDTFEHELDRAILGEDSEYNWRKAEIHLYCESESEAIQVKRCDFNGMTMER